MQDVNGLGEKIVSSVRGYVARSLEALEARIEALEARPVLPNLSERLEQVAEVAHASHRRIDVLPPPVDLTPITVKIDALPPPPDLAPLTERLAELEKRPTTEEFVTLAQNALNSSRVGMLETLQVSIVDLFKALPIPQKGDPGDPGKSVTVEDFRSMFEALYARFEVEAERRVTDLVQRAIERIPIPENGKPGRDGEDGFDLRHFDVVQIDERSFMLRFKDLMREKKHTLVFPVPIGRGIWKAGEPYARGDVVTWGGSQFEKLTDEPGGKPEESPAWRLVVKRGRDGKPGEKGDPGAPGKPGRNGRDLTQMGSDGSKWS